MTDLAARVKAADRDRWVAARMAGERGGRLLAIYAFDAEVARIPALVSEPILGEMRLQFWRDAVAAIFDGGRVPGHELAAPLAEAIREAGLPRTPFEAILDARRADLADEPFGDRAALDAWLAGAHAAPMALTARALGGGEATDRIAADLGHAAGIATLLRAAPARAARGRPPLPLQGPPAEIEAPEFRSAAREIADDALARLARARGRRGEAPPEAAPAFFAAIRAGPTLRRAARAGSDIRAALAGPSEFAARAELASRALVGRW